MSRAGEAPAVHIDVRFLRGALPADGGRMPVLVRIQPSPMPRDRRRTPIDLALVLDRSGSMEGEPLTAAKRAAHNAVDLLEGGDRVAIVAFGSTPSVIVPLRAVDDRSSIHALIEGISSDGSSAMHAGWVEGAVQLVDVLEPARAALVVMLTDGLATRGVRDPYNIVRDVGAMARRGIATSTIGLGPYFAEDLLSAMAHAGSGRFSFAEKVADLGELLATELLAVDAKIGRNVRLVVPRDSGRVRAVDLLNDFEVSVNRMKLPDLVQGVPLDVVIMVAVEPGPSGEGIELGKLELSWSNPDGTQARTQHRVTADMVQGRPYSELPDDPAVTVSAAVLSAARLRKRAMAALYQSDVEDARHIVDEIEQMLEPLADSSAVARERRSIVRMRAALDDPDGVLARNRLSADREIARKGFDPATYAEPALATRQKVEIVRADGSVAHLLLRLGDVTEADVDAIVNPTKPRLHGTGGSVDGAVHRRGGIELTRECRAIGQVEYGQAVVTRGWRLPASYVLHTAVTEFDGDPKSRAVLASCYASSLALARQLRLTRLAFPAMGGRISPYSPEPDEEIESSDLAEEIAASEQAREIALSEQAAEIALSEQAAKIALAELLRDLGAVGGARRIEVALVDHGMLRIYEQVLVQVLSERSGDEPGRMRLVKDPRDDATRECDRNIWAEVMQTRTPNDAMGSSAFMGAMEIAATIVLVMAHNPNPHWLLLELGAMDLCDSLERTLRYEATRRGEDGRELLN